MNRAELHAIRHESADLERFGGGAGWPEDWPQASFRMLALVVRALVAIGLSLIELVEIVRARR